MTLEQLLLETHNAFVKSSMMIAKEFQTCRVCGDKAHIKFYGALSCQSCKTFFRRYNLHSQIIRSCQYNGQCEVNMLSRHVCASCRLSKCFTVGMKADHIRKDRNKFTKIIPQISTLDLLSTDRSSLTSNQWTLISNVVHAYETFGLISTLKDIVQNVSLPVKQIQFTEVNALKMIGTMYTSIQSLINVTPEFQVLCVNEQKSLFQRNLHGIGSFYCNLLFRDSALFDNTICYRSYELAYGSEIMYQSKQLVKRLDLDSTLFKLMLIIITFSSNCFLVDFDESIPQDSFLYGTFRLYGSQNIYVEVLWQYMIYRYGYDDTVIRFNRIVKHILDMIKHVADVYLSHKTHQDFVDEVVEETKETLVITQNQPVALWGKAFQSR
ncbi:hypothetical protein I4U23_023589 [Adineta vaga]|nr:hypothetical protein I4U23_023589 [Adineta vaga]